MTCLSYQSTFAIDSGTGDLTFVSAPDHEMQERYEVEVTVTDNGGLTAVQKVVIKRAGSGVTSLALSVLTDKSFAS